MSSTRDIQRRIKSVKNTKKITKAMELVAASKMRRAVEAVLATRSYANLSWLTVQNVAQMGKSNKKLHELLEERHDIKKVAVILITSNRGLCGGFNSSAINKAVSSVRKHDNIPTDFILLGKKGRAVHSRFGYQLVADFEKNDARNQVAEVIPAIRMAMKEYVEGKYDKIVLTYTDYISSMKQVPRVKQLLPLQLGSTEEYLSSIEFGSKLEHETDVAAMMVEKQAKHFKNTLYEFEPSPEEVLDEMIPRLLEIQLFQALLESNASEHSARMLAMRNATEAAGDMIDDLTLFYNKARQAGITREISEIVGGVAALQN